MFVKKDLLLKVWARSLGNTDRRRAPLSKQTVGHKLPPKRVRARGRAYAYHHRRTITFVAPVPAPTAEILAFPAAG
jgi:hypothetical protein